MFLCVDRQDELMDVLRGATSRGCVGAGVIRCLSLDTEAADADDPFTSVANSDSLSADEVTSSTERSTQVCAAGRAHIWRSFVEIFFLILATAASYHESFPAVAAATCGRRCGLQPAVRALAELSCASFEIGHGHSGTRFLASDATRREREYDDHNDLAFSGPRRDMLWTSLSQLPS